MLKSVEEFLPLQAIDAEISHNDTKVGNIVG
jgi:hypothetical protein